MFKFFNFKNNLTKPCNKGYLLIESMVAISILIIGVLGILNIFSRSAGLNQVVNDQFIGTYLAAEGVEIVKNIIDSNIINKRPWNEGINNGEFEVDYISLNLSPNQSSYLLFDSETNFYSYQKGSPTKFIRTIIINVNSEIIKVNSTVKWKTRGGGEFKADIEDYFYNWRPE